ncbi:carbohydrate-binding module family 13 protein [Rhizophagus clarus]|uniref:Carbohydrate-binding module family 13 protein n=1 Tax=Rhizophagus clarus TaxID=94130 RepID=A0A8H3L045_9GLOM|nr:carbohydrate-binding module family 13 protein [Rhizophagus clarus]
MVDNKLLPILSQNLLEILNDEEYYDITIEVVLRYIYGGKLSLEEYDPSDIIKILIASNELNLLELIPCLESFLIENRKNWMEQNFDLIFKTSFENDSFVELQKYCTNLISNEPEKIFTSLNFISIPEKLLLSLIKNDNLQMSIHVWYYVIKWGLARNPELSSDPKRYSKNDFSALKNTLQQCIPFIKFHNLTSKEFSKKVIPYKKIFPKDLYNNLLNDFLDNDNKPIKKPVTNDTENKEIEEIQSNVIDSKIITLQHAEIISKWINGQKSTDELEISYKFKLLYRETVDGFDRFKKFHEVCNNQSRTVTIVKLRGRNVILGGYNPIEWRKYDNSFGITTDSFLFSFNHDDINEHILSHVQDEESAIQNSNFHGPSFGNGDLFFYNDFNYELMVRCTQQSYEEQIKDIEISYISEFDKHEVDNFVVDEIEVFKII